MKIFEGGEWGRKVNFVDENNVILGFDMAQDCCEDFGWFIHHEISDETLDGGVPENIEDYFFDTSFFEQRDGGCRNGGGIAVFKIVSKTGEVRYIHLYNFHNGYYSHGFELNVGGQIVLDRSL